MDCSSNGVERLNSFALVTYTPDPLGAFLNHLRQELVHACRIQSHVTVLPPRPISGTAEQAWAQLQEQLRDTASFRIELDRVNVFSGTNVVFIEIGEGRRQLLELHHQLNDRYLGFEEPYTYHPHLTLAQGVSEENVAAVADLARRRWAEFRFSRSFDVDSLVFVQQTANNQWVDLAEYRLPTVTLVR
ncbi:MAG: 2'-5' RNA ligase family protein [Bryobacteraceae bacterium]|nr:2'-5' RNA ligase family protein [Bryobacteraceae bacterium]